MKKNFRITFYDGPEGNLSKDVDVYAETSKEAMQMAYKMPEAKDRRFTDVLVQEIPKEPSVIGIQYEYLDTYSNTKATQYLFVKANSETEAIDYYNRHFKNNRFSFPNQNKIDENGIFIRGKVVKSYFASGMSYNVDATVKTNESLNKKIQDAAKRKGKVQDANLPLSKER